MLLLPQPEVDDGRQTFGVTSITFSISAAEGDEAYSSCSGPSMSASLKPWFRSSRRRRLFSSRTFRAAAWISCEASAPTASHERYLASSSCRYSLRRARDRRWLSLPKSTQISLFLGPVTANGVWVPDARQVGLLLWRRITHLDVLLVVRWHCLVKSRGTAVGGQMHRGHEVLRNRAQRPSIGSECSSLSL